ncbi:MAG: hypothetical protein ACUVRL_06355 [Candidatus Saccharicenans sp.]|uniref:hypothetical protein n=1 Tax=Candidatus Saccharicenans sp. TaxID=2819258 RepID=UPI00404ACEEC
MGYPRMKSLMVLILVLALTFSLFNYSYGQQKRHEFSVGYGLVTSSQIADILTNILLITITIGEAAKVDNKYPGAFILSYKYVGRSRLAFGLTFAYDRASGNLAMSGNPVGTYSENYYTGAAEIDYRFINRKNFCLYSGLGLGLTVRKGTYTYSDTETSTNSFPIVHVTLLGFRVGDKIAFFGELGGGYKGIFHCGIRASI